MTGYFTSVELTDEQLQAVHLFASAMGLSINSAISFIVTEQLKKGANKCANESIANLINRMNNVSDTFNELVAQVDLMAATSGTTARLRKAEKI